MWYDINTEVEEDTEILKASGRLLNSDLQPGAKKTEKHTKKHTNLEACTENDSTEFAQLVSGLYDNQKKR